LLEKSFLWQAARRFGGSLGSIIKKAPAAIAEELFV
jgi:hypothetical protein